MKRVPSSQVVLTCLLGLVLVALVVMPLIGPERLRLTRATFSIASKSQASFIFWQVRVPRVLLALVVGWGLAIAGMSLQALLRNSLADPYVLGISGGAALGTAIAMQFRTAPAHWGVSTLSVASFLGALVSIVLLYGITARSESRSSLGPSQFSTHTMLLIGVALGFLCSALILLIQYFADFTDTFRMVRWMMGSMSVVGYQPLLRVTPFVAVGAAVILFHRHELNLLLLGDEIAASRGVNCDRVKKIIFLATALITGVTVAECGPIGFVGLVIPHIMRLLVGADHLPLTIASALGGGLFLLLCDTAARSCLPPAEIPIGVVTALVGAPFFIWLLVRRHKNLHAA